MPPFRTGLHKRKLTEQDTEASKNESSSIINDSSEVSDDLLHGDIDDADDATDSENESEENDSSEEEVEKVMFGEDADSTLGDEDDLDSGDESSELTDSEDDQDEEDGSNDDDDSDNEKSTDSGAESGPSLAHSSDESDKHIVKRNVQKNKKKVDKQANIKPASKSSIDILADKISESNLNILPVEQKDEYESGDTSDEEDRRNTVGNVPLWWYDEYPHVGYDLDGRPLLRPPRRDQIDDFLQKCEDPDFWRTVKDPSTGQDIRLSKEDLQLLVRLRQRQTPTDKEEYEPWVEWFSREVLATPLRAFPEHKRSFLPSRDEQRRVARLVHALKMGWTKTRRQLAQERKEAKLKKFYDLWGSGSEESARGVQRHIPAPRRPPPSHAESYNPPPEYLLDGAEMKEWDKLAETPWKRKYTFLPTQHGSLRAVPAYERFLRERFLRCLDLYLAPRAIKMRLTIRPEELVPRLPAPRDLQPFPTQLALCMRGHVAAVRAVDVDPAGQYALSASDDGTLKVWELSTGRCLRTLAVGEAGEAGQAEAVEAVVRARWCPARGLSLAGAAAGRRLVLLNPGSDVGAHRVAARTDRLLATPPAHHDVAMDARTAAAVQWEPVAAAQWARGVRLVVRHCSDIVHMSWHARGDYLCTVTRAQGAAALVVHQLSRRRSQLPLRRSPGLLQAATFHPTRPHLIVATQRAVRIYDLAKQQMLRKLQPSAKWLSDVVLHPGGDNLLAVSYDGRCNWFDLELSARPYQTLRLHARAVRGAAFHPRYPLFATAGDDRHVVVCHGMVYNDLLQNPLLVPLKQLEGAPPRDGLSTLALCWHPAQPWLLAAGADGCVRLYS